MVRIKDFITYMRSKYLNHCAYLWGGSGQIVGKTTPDEIIKAESTSDKPKINARRVLTFVGKMAEYGYNLDIAQFFDCSGYVIDGLTHFELFYGDTTANGLYNLGTPISVKNAQPGDLVFLGSKERKTHVGVYAGDGVCYECKGRDDGVVMSNLSDWTFAARFTWFDKFTLTRKLKVADKPLEGGDVSFLQRALCSHGFPCKVTGTFTTNTADAVKKFQKAAKLSVISSGVVAKKTAEALGITWSKK